jgi:hypothetical protein
LYRARNPVSYLLALLSGLLACCLGCGSGIVTNSVTSATLPSIWVGAWANAMTNANPVESNKGGKDRSFRFLIYPTIGGSEERVRFSNLYGLTPVTIGAARLAVGRDGSPAVDSEENVALSFDGKPSVTLAPGQVLNSDPVKVTFSFGQVLAVSVYLQGSFGPVSRHNALFPVNYQAADDSGDNTADLAGTKFVAAHSEWLLLNGLDVYGPYQGTFVLFGSSTTDGFHSNYSADKVYPVPNTPVEGQHESRLSDWLARRLNAAGYKIGVVNLGIPGDTVTNDITNTTSNVQNANQRISHDVLTIPHPLAMVSYFGSIDIRSPECKSAPAIEEATTRLVATAHAANLPVLLATLPPSAFCTNPTQANYGPVPSPSDPYAGGVGGSGIANGGEVQRMLLNEWIRSTGVNLPGVVGVAEFSKALEDSARPSFLQSQYNSGDNYHPNGNGYHAEALSIPLVSLPAPLP